MNTKKIIAGITMIGMIWAVPAVSPAGEHNDRSVREQARMEPHHRDQENHWDGRHRVYDRHGRHGDWRDSYQGAHRQNHHGYYDRDNAHRNQGRNEGHASHPRWRVVVTPFGIFPVFY